jgi:hypothetical protein
MVPEIPVASIRVDRRQIGAQTDRSTEPSTEEARGRSFLKKENAACEDNRATPSSFLAQKEEETTGDATREG